MKTKLPFAFIFSFLLLSTIINATNNEVYTSVALNSVANPIDDLEACDSSFSDPNDGLAAFDTTNVEMQVLGDQTNVTVTYSDGNGNPLPGPLPNPLFNSIAFVETITVALTDNTTGEQDITTFDLIVNALPDIPSGLSLSICDDDNDGISEFNLTTLDAQITSGSPDLIVSYHLTQEDAENGILSISNPFLNNEPFIQIIYVRVENLITGCFSVGPVELIVLDTPIPNESIASLVDCDIDGNNFGAFDLTTREADILNGMDPSTFFISWFVTLIDAQSGFPAIADPTNYVSTTTIVYAVVENASQTQSCFSDPVALDLIVSTSPVIVEPTPLSLCDDESSGSTTDQISAFDLNVLVDGITQGDPTLNVSFFASQADLNAGIPITNPSNYQNVVNPQTIQILVNNGNGCTVQTQTTLSVLPLPTPNTGPFALEVCDNDNDSFGVFELVELDAVISNGEPNLSITYYLTEDDATIGDPALALTSPFINTVPFIQTIFARVEDIISNCFVTIPVDLIINPVPLINPDRIDPFILCSDNDETVNINTDPGVLTNLLDPSQDINDFITDYYLTEVDAVNQTNPLAFPFFIDESGMGSATIFASIQNLNTGCMTVIDLTFIVDTCTDFDGDGVIDIEEDLNGNGNLEDDDTDEDDIPNFEDEDDDGDTVMTIDEITGIGAGLSNIPFIDTDEDGIQNYLDNDDDGDLTLTIDEDYNFNGSPLDDDTNANGIPDFLDDDVFLAIDDFETDTFTFYPNPSSSFITIESIIVINTVKIYDAQGRLIREISAFSDREITIDITDYVTGIYFIRINNLATQKFVKQ